MTGAGPVAGFPHAVLGATRTDHGRGACGAAWGCPSRRHPREGIAPRAQGIDRGIGV